MTHCSQQDEKRPPRGRHLIESSGMRHGRILVPLVSILWLATAVGSAQAERKGAQNRIQSVTSSAAKEGGGATEVRIRGTRTPTFSVYHLEHPPRVIIDISGATLHQKLASRGESRAAWAVNSWSVGQVTAYAIGQGEDDDRQSMVRVVVGMARPSSYRAKAQGRDILVTVAPHEPAPAGQEGDLGRASSKRLVQMKAATKAAEAERKEAEQARARAVAKAAEAEKRAEEAQVLRQREEAAFRRAERARGAAEMKAAEAERAAARLSELQSAIASARKQLTATERRAERAERRVNTMEARENTRTRDVEAARRKAAALDRDRKQAESSLAELRRQLVAQERRTQELASERQDAENSLAQLRREARTLEKQRQTEEAKLAEIDAAKAAAEQARQAEERKLTRLSERRRALEAEVAKAQKRAERAESLAEKAADREAELTRLKRQLADARSAHAKEKAHLQTLAERRQALAREIAREQKQRRARQQSAERVRSLEGELAELETAIAKAKQTRTAEERKLSELSALRKTTEAKAKEARADSRRAEAARREGDQLKRELAQLGQAAKEARLAQEREARQLETLAGERKALERRIAEMHTQLQDAAGAEQDVQRTQAELKTLNEAATSARQARAAEEARLAELARKRNQLEREIEGLEKRSSKRKTRRQREQTEIDRQRDRALGELEDLDWAVAKAKKSQDAEERKLAQLSAERAKLERDLAQAEAKLGEAQARHRALATVDKKASKPSKAASRGKSKGQSTGSVTVRDVDFVDARKYARVVIDLADSAAKPEIVSAQGRRMVLEFDGVALPGKLERTLDTRPYRGPIQAVSSYRPANEPAKMRVVVDLAYPAKHALKRDGDTYYWDFAKRTQRGAVASRQAYGASANANASVNRRSRGASSRASRVPRAASQSRTASSRTQNFRAPVIGGYGAATTPITQKTVAQLAGQRQRVYRGTKIDIDLKDVDIHNVMRLLADVGGINIVVPDDVKARVTVRLRQVPWDQALEVILASKGLWYRRQGNLYRIATRKELDAEYEAERQRRQDQIESEAPEPQIFTLNYAVAKDIKPQLDPLLSKKGRIEIDERTNALIISDVREHRSRIIDLLTRLDTQTPQIQIEARIVEARSNFVREFGVQWGGRNTNANTGLIFPNDVNVAGGNVDQQTLSTGVLAADPDFAVNLPAAVGTGAGGAVGFALGSVGGNVNLTLRLSALEDSGSVRIISAPKITVLNNIQAEISQGVSIPISVISANGVQTQFVPADLSLKVTPHVSQRDCSIAMELEVEKNEADFVNTGARGDPSILRKEAKTTVLVADNETTVIGGIYTRNSGLSYSKVPFFGDLPLLGWFFKNRRENDDRSEVLVFVTPRITNRAFLRCE